MNIEQPKNKNLKWVASVDPKTNIKSLVVVSTETYRVELIFSKNILKKMESVGDFTSTRVKRISEEGPVYIMPMSVLSIQFE